LTALSFSYRIGLKNGANVVNNWFDKSAKYLFVYSGTLTPQEWKTIIKQVYKDNERLYGISGAQAMTIAMVAYYCIEVGSMYKGRQAASKFKSCNRWPDFSIPDAYWKEEWEERKILDLQIESVETKLIEYGVTLPPDKIEASNWSRDALYLILDEIEYRHGKETRERMEPEMRKFISLYSGFATLNFIQTGKIRNRELIPNLVSSYFLQRAIVQEFGDSIVDMKKAELEGRV
jgi:hypothetical protein